MVYTPTHTHTWKKYLTFFFYLPVFRIDEKLLPYHPPEGIRRFFYLSLNAIAIKIPSGFFQKSTG